MKKVLTQSEARKVLRTLELLVSYKAWVDEIHIGSEAKFICYLSGGYGVSLGNRTVAEYDSLHHFAGHYQLTWM